MEILKNLTRLFGVSGFESQISEYIFNTAKPLCDEIKIDVLGNVIALKKGLNSERRIMLCASVDSRGFIVTVKDGGIFRFGNIGACTPSSLVGQSVEFENGAKGIIGSDTDKDIKIKNLYVDITEGSADTGDVFALCSDIYINDNYIVSGKLSSVMGAYVLLQVMERLKDNKNDVYFVFAAQSALAYRGSKTASFDTSPDIAITVGTANTGDVPSAGKSNITLGGGPAIKIKDSSILAHPLIKSALSDSARKAGIDYQAEVSGESSEGGAIHLAGGAVMTGGISIPLRYKGKQNEMCLIKDMENTVKMILGCELL